MVSSLHKLTFEEAFNRKIGLSQHDSDLITQQLQKWTDDQYFGTPQYVRATHYLALCVKKIEKQLLGGLSEEILARCKINIQRAVERDELIERKQKLTLECAVLELSSKTKTDPQTPSANESQLRDRVKTLQFEIGVLKSMKAQPAAPSGSLETPEALERVKLLQQKVQLEFERLFLEKSISQSSQEGARETPQKLDLLQVKVRRLEWEISASKAVSKFDNDVSLASQIPPGGLNERVRRKVQWAKDEIDKLNKKNADLERSWRAQAKLCEQRNTEVAVRARTVDGTFKSTIQKEEELQSVRAKSLKKIQELQKQIDEAIEGMSKEPARLDEECTKLDDEIIPKINTTKDDFYKTLEKKLKKQQNKLHKLATNCLNAITAENNAFADKPNEISNDGIRQRDANDRASNGNINSLCERFNQEIVLHRSYYIEKWNSASSEASQERSRAGDLCNESWSSAHSSRNQRLSNVLGEKREVIQTIYNEDIAAAGTVFTSSRDKFSKEYGKLLDVYKDVSKDVRAEKQELKKEIRAQVKELRGEK